MAENLIPSGLPYGERQKLVAARQQAGLPIDTPTPPPTLGGAAPSQPGMGLFAGMRPARPQYDPLLEATPDQFPGVTQPAHTNTDVAPPVDELDALVQAGQQSQSTLVRMVAERLANRGR